MSGNIKQSITGGIMATAAMTIITLVAPMMGFPKMSPPAMLAGMLGVPLFAGWLMHFMTGIIFALAYTFLIKKLLQQIANLYVKGAVFGMIVFIFAMVMVMAMGEMVASMPLPAGSMGLMFLGGTMGHIVYGITVVQFIKD